MVYGRASMGVPVGELQYSTVLDGHVRPRRTVIGRRLGLRRKNFFLSWTETWLLESRCR